MAATRKVTCPSCMKTHAIDDKTFAMFGPDTMCMKCVDWAHIDWMNTTGKKIGASCVKGCRCSAKVKK